MTADWWDWIVAALTTPSAAYWPVYVGLLLSVLVVAALLYALFGRRRGDSLQRALEELSYEQLRNVVLPKADDGEIHIDHILLTERGILIVEAKEIRGIVFGGDRMHDWTVMDNGRRYTIANPQAALYDRIAAVRLVVSDVPVEGRIVFGADADFSKGLPSLVCTEQQLRAELPVVSGKRGSASRSAFDPHWQTLRDAAFR